MELKEFQKMLENQKVKSQFPGFGEITWKHIQYILKSYGHLYEDDRSNTDDNTKEAKYNSIGIVSFSITL